MVKVDVKMVYVVSVVVFFDIIIVDGVDSSIIILWVEDDYGFLVEGVDVCYVLDIKGCLVVNILIMCID